ncbi:hypothetical protein F5888DRAFT_1695650 [Russula emetica]|nr:hypothetical protein F5888DRAFT_1695572 [Russula emetica]KAF8497831.1 hypothetical protein F5888DRAFT_1695650 [Russula emetica]
MPMMGTRYKSILRVALRRIFVFAVCICSQSSPRTGRFGMMSEMGSLLDVRKGLDYNLFFCQLRMVIRIGMSCGSAGSLYCWQFPADIDTSPIRLKLSP